MPLKMVNVNHLLVLIVVATSIIEDWFVAAGRHEDQLISDIFNTRGYTPIARPVLNESEAVEVQFGVTLQSIINLDEKQELLISRLWLEYLWVDPKLTWNPKDYGGITSIRLAWDKIWTPDILLYNSAASAIDTKFPVSVIVTNDGTCKWMPLGIFTSSCGINIRWFPFDEQKCKLKFGSWTYHGNLLNLTERKGTNGMGLEFFQKNGEWELIGAPAVRTIFAYDCCKDAPYIDITYYLHIRRRTLYYGSNLIIPCALISSLCIFTFMLPPDTNAKVSLGITTLLALSVFQLIVADMVPSTSMSVPLVGTYFVFLMFMCTISLVVTIFVINFHHRKPNMKKVSPFIDKYIINYLAWLVRLSRPSKKPKSPFSRDVPNKTVNLDTSKFMVPSLPHPNSANARFATFLNMQNTKLTAKFPPNSNSSPKEANKKQGQVKASTELNISTKVNLMKLKHELASILYEMRFITTHVKENDLEQDEINDWKFAAMVIDRCGLIIFTIYIIVVTLSIFFSSENLRNSIGKNSDS